MSSVRLGWLVTLGVTALLLAGVWVTNPWLDPDALAHADFKGLEEASQKLDAYPVTELSSPIRVFARSWDRWVSEMRSRDKKVGSNPETFAHGARKIKTNLLFISVATVLGGLLFWLGVLVVAAVSSNPRVRGGVIARIVLLLCGAGLALPCWPCEDWTGIAFSSPAVIGGIVALIARKKSGQGAAPLRADGLGAGR